MFRPTKRSHGFATCPRPWPLVKFSIWYFEVKLKFVWRVSPRGARCWQNECRTFVESKVITKQRFSWKQPFWVLLSGGYNPLILPVINSETNYAESVERAIQCAFPRRCSFFSSRVMEKKLSNKNVVIGKIWPFMSNDLWWPGLWPPLKNDQSSSVIIFWRSFEWRLSRVATSSRNPSARRVRCQAPVRCRLKIYHYYDHYGLPPPPDILNLRSDGGLLRAPLHFSACQKTFGTSNHTFFSHML